VENLRYYYLRYYLRYYFSLELRCKSDKHLACSLKIN